MRIGIFSLYLFLSLDLSLSISLSISPFLPFSSSHLIFFRQYLRVPRLLRLAPGLEDQIIELAPLLVRLRRETKATFANGGNVLDGDGKP